jgi:hypothetical protein
MNLEVFLEEAAKNPNKDMIRNNDARLGESADCSFNDIKSIIMLENSNCDDNELIEYLCSNEYDLEPVKSKNPLDLIYEKPLAERLNFSYKKENDSCVRVNKWCNVNYHETLSLYCADNEINLMMYTANDFDGAVETLETFGQDDKEFDYYYFWID